MVYVLENESGKSKRGVWGARLPKNNAIVTLGDSVGSFFTSNTGFRVSAFRGKCACASGVSHKRVFKRDSFGAFVRTFS